MFLEVVESYRAIMPAPCGYEQAMPPAHLSLPPWSGAQGRAPAHSDEDAIEAIALLGEN